MNHFDPEDGFDVSVMKIHRRRMKQDAIKALIKATILMLIIAVLYGLNKVLTNA